jgi:protoporphyrinogen IX oxidase
MVTFVNEKSSMYLTLKALHIIFIVTWFAGLFYIPRLFIYHTEANLKQEPDKSILMVQFQKMERLLWYVITWPSAVITFILGAFLLYDSPSYLTQSYMHIKLGFVVLLYVYHFFLHRIFKQLQSNHVKYTSMALRYINEIATVILFAIVFLIVFKESIGWIYGIGALFILIISIVTGTFIYKKRREKNASKGR